MPRYKKVADEQKNKGRKRKIAGIFMLLAGLLVAASDIGVTSSFWSEMSAYLLKSVQQLPEPRIFFKDQRDGR